MKLIEDNIIKKILRFLIPKSYLYIADDFNRINILFGRQNNYNFLYLNLRKFLFPKSVGIIFFKFPLSKDKKLILKKISTYLIEELNFSDLENYLAKLTEINKIRIYRLLIFYNKYIESNKIRFSSSFKKIFQKEDKEIYKFQKNINPFKNDRKNKKIAVIGPLNDLDQYKSELINFDEILLINPSEKFDFNSYPNTKFSYYYRSPSISAIEKQEFNLPKLNPNFVITEHKIKSYSILRKRFQKNIKIINYSDLLCDKNLFGKLNAIQSIVLHLLQEGYRDIGIYGCDLFLTSRTKNKRDDYAPYQKLINKNLEKKNLEYAHFICHDPYLNFIILKILKQQNLIYPYDTLEKILNLSYKEYILKLSKIINS